MRTELRAPSSDITYCGSTEGYTSTVNKRQHVRRFSALVALVAALFGTGLCAPQVALAQEKPAAPKKAPKARLADVLEPLMEEAPEAKAARGIVVLQRAGQPIGLGTVLGKDGRILTALSPLGAGNDLEAKFADDTVQKLKLGHHDRLWDLALLVPQGGKWKEGLSASNSDPLREGATIRSFTGAAGKSKPVAKEVELRSRRALLGGDDKMLNNALEMGSAINSKDIGAPLIDEKGKVVGVLGRACLPIEGKPCAPVAYGVPVSAIKSFLKSVPPDAVQPSPWLGIQGVSESSPVVKGVRVLSVAKGSPAADAKLKGGEKGEGDMIVAVGGKPVTSPEELATAIKARSIGEKVPLTVFSKGLYRQSDIILKAPPETAKSAPAASAPKEEERTFATPPPSKSRKAANPLKVAKPQKAQKAEAPKASKATKKAPPRDEDEDDMFDQAD